jgi:hypothetical protein
MIPYKDHNGIPALLGREEYEATERSGRSSWQVYAQVPTEYIMQQCVSDGIAKRPGATNKGDLGPPRYTPPDKNAHHLRGFGEMEKGLIHCRRNGLCLCDGKQHNGAFSVERFTSALGHERVCQECVVQYYRFPKAGRHWDPLHLDRLMVEWPDYRKRKALLMVLNRSAKACEAKYKKELAIRMEG